MQNIADLADVGARTVYSYFKSKRELATAVMERVMHNFALRIEAITDTFSDPAQVYAFGVRTVMEAATGDIRWKQLLNRAEVIADAMFRCMGPFAIRDPQNATLAVSSGGLIHNSDLKLKVVRALNLAGLDWVEDVKLERHLRVPNCIHSASTAG
jgi:AcrR family transcriptional regulator